MIKLELGYHRKYRPNRLSEYIGNDKIVKSIIETLKDGKRPQVFLFDGHAGCGKTTVSRLLAKEYLCEDRDDEHGACCNCVTCRNMDEYIRTGDNRELLGVKEIDCSVGGKAQELDNILNEAETPSFDDSWKVFIFDECHLISKVAQGRMLKILEEPPEKVLMILCTTDPDMLLDTIRSRCQHHHTVVKPSLNELAKHLKKVCKNEGVECEDRALGVIATAADFVPRQALIQLETVVNEKHSVTYENTIEVLNIISDKYYYDFYNYLLEPQIDVFKYINFLSELKEHEDLKRFIAGLITFTNRGIYVYNGVVPQGLDTSEIKRYRKIFSRFSNTDIINLLKLLKNIKTGDIETELLLLGYEGLLNRNQMQNNELDGAVLIKDTGNEDVSKEHSVGVQSYIDNKTITEEKEEEILNKSDDSMSIDDLAALFGGEVVKVDDN